MSLKVPEAVYPLHPRTLPQSMDRRGFIGTCLRAGAAAALSYMLPAEIFGGTEFREVAGLEKKHTVVEVDKTYPVIFIWLVGGPSKYETFRPGSPEKGSSNYVPSDFRGIFKPIQTTVPGVEICELMPQVAQRMKKIAIVDTVVHRNHDHFEAQGMSLTGSKDFKDGTKTPKFKTPFVEHSERYSIEDLKQNNPIYYYQRRVRPNSK